MSYIDMNQPWSYMYSPSRSPLPPPSPPNSSGSWEALSNDKDHQNELAAWDSQESLSFPLICEQPSPFFFFQIFPSLFIYLCVCVCVCAHMHTLCHIQLLRPHGLWPTRLLCPWDSPGKNTGVGCHFILYGIFLTQGLNPCLLCLLYWQVDSLPLCHSLFSQEQNCFTLLCSLVLYNEVNQWHADIHPLGHVPSAPPPRPSRSSQSTQPRPLCHSAASP